jgi:DHA2 family multidrug resistance protein
MAQTYGIGVIVRPLTWTTIRTIVDNFSWPYIFYINIPGIITLLLTITFVKEAPKYGEKLKSPSRLDWNNFTASFIGSLQFVLEHDKTIGFNIPLVLSTLSILD